MYVGFDEANLDVRETDRVARNCGWPLASSREDVSLSVSEDKAYKEGFSVAVGKWTQRRPRDVQKESSKGSHEAGRSGLGSSARLPDPQGSLAVRAAAFLAGPFSCIHIPLFMPPLPEEPPAASLCSSQPPAEHLTSDSTGTAQPHCPAFPVPGSTHSR